MDDIKVDLKNADLVKLIRMFGGIIPKVRLGILGDKTNRKAGQGEVPSNAEIGLKHEYGDNEVPCRSFLRMPIQTKLNKYLEKEGAFEKDTLDKMVKEGNLVEFVKKIGVISETVVLDAFHTGGFGAWPPHSPNYENNTGMLLVDTQQLRNSITHEVVE
jgi:hypothetical protein